MKNFNGYKHEWKFDLPWHMVDLKDWFYMVNVGYFGDVFLHVRVLGIRSLWTFPEWTTYNTHKYIAANAELADLNATLIDFVSEVNYSPYSDSDCLSLLESLRSRAAEILREFGAQRKSK